MFSILKIEFYSYVDDFPLYIETRFKIDSAKK